MWPCEQDFAITAKHVDDDGFGDDDDDNTTTATGVTGV